MALTNTANHSSSAAIPDQSPRHSGESMSSPRSRRPSRTGSPPWTQIVRGDSESIAAIPSSPLASSSPTAVVETVVSCSSSTSLSSAEDSTENCGGPNGIPGRKPAWNKPSNGATEVGPVMGAVSWPALSESTKASTKSYSEPPRGFADASSAGSASQKKVNNGGNSNSNPKHQVLNRQRSMKHNTANILSNGGLHQQPAPGPVIETSPNSPSPKENPQRSGFMSQSHSGNDHIQQRNSYRSRNGGSHPRGDGPHHASYGGRRDQDRGYQDWNGRRNFNGQPQRVMTRVLRPPPPPTVPFFPVLQVRPYGGHIPVAEFHPPVSYVAVPPPEAFRSMPFVAPLPHPPVLFAAPESQLPVKIVNQIEYYFSNENLVKDTYLRQNMDGQGWVPIKLIAGFNKVTQLMGNVKDNVSFILDALRMSTTVEVQGDYVRRRNDWMRWIMPSSSQLSNASGHQSPGKPPDGTLSSRLQDISLEAEATQSMSSEDLNTQLQSPPDEPTEYFCAQDGTDHSNSARS